MIVKESKKDIFNELHISAMQNSKLFMAEIDVTNICNCKCPFCFQGSVHQDKEKILSFEEIVQLLDDLKSLGCYYVSFSGGEPFCRKDFVKILKEAKKRGFYVNFVSHLQLASDEDIAEINKLGIERVLVSFHSHKPKMYAKIFNVDEKFYWRVLKNIENLISGGTPVGITTTVFNENAKDLYEIRKMFMKMGVPKAKVRFNPLLEGKTHVEKLRGEQELCDYLSLNKDLKINILSKARTREASFTCSAGKRACLIHPNGDVAPCGFINKVAGNIRKDSLENIWKNSEVFHEIRNIKKCEFTKCSECEDLAMCPICIGTNLNETGKYCTPSDDYCHFRKSMNKALEV